MPHVFRQPVANYRNAEEFAETAIKTLNSMFGRHKANGKREDMHTFDFSIEHCQEHKQDFFTCVGYFRHERMPKAPAAGAELSPGQVEAVKEARSGNVKSFLDAIGVGRKAKPGKPNATEGAVKLAEVYKIDLSLVKGSGADGKVTQPDVAAYMKANAPAQDKADDEANSQQ